MGESNRKNTEGERERERLGESNRKNTEGMRERERSETQAVSGRLTHGQWL